MEHLYHFIRENTESLYTVVYNSNVFFIDYWSAIHFCNGILLMAIARSFFCTHRWTILLGILFAYELLEIAFIYISIDIFLPETIPDQITDIIVGLIGALLVDFAAMVRSHTRWWRMTGWRRREVAVEFFTAMAISFLWVSTYGYSYNFKFFNSPVVNWWALTLWTCGLFIILRLHNVLRRSGIPGLAAISFSWFVYCLGMMVIEFLGYRVLGIQEISGYPPLILGLVHGSTALKIYYIVAAPLIIVIVTLFKKTGFIRTTQVRRN